MSEQLLELFRGNAKSIDTARSIVSELAHGSYSKETRKQAREILILEKKGELSPPDLANHLADLLSKSFKTFNNLKYLR